MTAPTRSVLLFDGDCGFCTRSATFIGSRLAPPGQALAWQTVDLSDFGLDASDVSDASWWFDHAGSPHRGAAAITTALAAGTGPWSHLGRWATRAPLRWLAAGVYPVVIRLRHRLPGATDHCALPSQPPDGETGSHR